MKYESTILKRLIDTYGVVGNPQYISEIIKEFIVQGKECYPDLFTYQADWLAHIDEFGLNPSYTVSYTGQSIYAPNTKEKPVKRAILKGSTKYRDIDTGEVLDAFEDGRNLELVSVRMPVLTTTGKNLFDREAFYNDWKGKQAEYIYKETVDGEDVLKIYNLHLLNDDNKGFKIFVEKDVPLTLTFKCKKAGTADTNAVLTVWYGDKTFKDVGSCNSDVWIERSATFIPTRNYITISSAYMRKDYYYIKDIQLEQGTQKTSYEPYQSNILTVNEDVTLRGIGNAQDTLDCLTGEVTERIGEIVLDGNSTFSSVITQQNGIRIQYNNDNKKRGTNIPVISNKFNFVSYSNTNIPFTVFCGNNSDIYFMLPLNSNVTSIADAKNWFNENNTIIQFPLTTEVVKTVDLSILDQNGQNVKQLMAFNGGTHFNTGSSEGSPLPTVSVSVETDLEETIKVCSLEGNTL